MSGKIVLEYPPIKILASTRRRRLVARPTPVYGVVSSSTRARAELYAKLRAYVNEKNAIKRGLFSAHVTYLKTVRYPCEWQFNKTPLNDHGMVVKLREQ